MPRFKHLPIDQVPEADLMAFRSAYERADVFDVTGGAAAHLAKGTRRMLFTGYRRWLGFLSEEELAAHPADRITLDRVRAMLIDCGRKCGPPL